MPRWFRPSLFHFQGERRPACCCDWATVIVTGQREVRVRWDATGFEESVLSWKEVRRVRHWLEVLNPLPPTVPDPPCIAPRCSLSLSPFLSRFLAFSLAFSLSFSLSLSLSLSRVRSLQFTLARYMPPPPPQSQSLFSPDAAADPPPVCIHPPVQPAICACTRRCLSLAATCPRDVMNQRVRRCCLAGDHVHQRPSQTPPLPRL